VASEDALRVGFPSGHGRKTGETTHRKVENTPIKKDTVHSIDKIADRALSTALEPLSHVVDLEKKVLPTCAYTPMSKPFIEK
jgi:hypothetical protein